MWSNRGCAVASIALVPLRLVEIFDGSPDALVPDKAATVSRYWQLGYVYDDDRFVTIRCKYADDETVDIKLSKKVDRCNYEPPRQGA